MALSFDIADVTVADEAQAKDWINAHPGQARILKMTRPVPGGMNMVVRKDFCATECGRLADWVNSPDGAIEQLAMMSMLAGTELGRAELVDYVRATVDVFIQLGQVDGTRLITEIKFRRSGNIEPASLKV